MEEKVYAVFRVIANHPRVGMTGIRNMTNLPADEIRESIKTLVEQGRVVRKRGFRYQAKEMYTQMSLYAS